MVDCPSTGVGGGDGDAPSARSHVGAVILDGTSQQGLQATAAVTARLRGAGPARVPACSSPPTRRAAWCSGCRAPGFASIPSAVTQGGIAPATAAAAAPSQWGAELRRAGVNVNLAPVLDTVPPGGGPNPPIGDLDREYGHTPAAVTSHGVAVARGMLAARRRPHGEALPGAGPGARQHRHDQRRHRHRHHPPGRRTSRRSAPPCGAGVPFVMMSTAIYSQIDPGTPAAFSHRIVTDVLRGDLGFRGVVISDDVGAAKQVAQYSPGQRAVRFVAAGGDIVLTVVAGPGGAR